MISKDTVKSILQIIKNNMTLRNYFIFFLISYCSVTNIYLPQSMIILLNQPVIKIIVLLFILYFSKKDTIMSVLLVFSLLLTINLKQTLDLSHMFNKEQFTLGNDKDDDSDDEDDNNDGDDDVNDNEDDDDDDEDEDNHNGDESELNIDDDSDDELEKYTHNHPELRDGFSKLHNAIHEYENYINK